MTKEIVRHLKELLEVSERMMTRELPKVAGVIRSFGEWLVTMEYGSIIKMDSTDKSEYDEHKHKDIANRIERTTQEEKE